MKFTTITKAFHDLSPSELYDILRLRSEVFVVEQKCIFLDMDDKDQFCDHVTIHSDMLIATARLVPPGISYPEMSIGRIVTHKKVRQNGIGKILMNVALKMLYEKYGVQPIKIGAQLYLRTFYESFGFVPCGEVYDEDGIDHIHMLKS